MTKTVPTTVLLALIVSCARAPIRSDPDEMEESADAPGLDPYGEGGIPVRPSLDLQLLPGAFPESRRSPLVSDIGDHRGLTFDHDDRTYLELSRKEQEQGRFTGAFTIIAEVRIDRRPALRNAIISRYRRKEADRSYEMGIQCSQYPYMIVSESGERQKGTRMLVGDTAVRLWADVLIAAVFQPGERMALYVDGYPAGELTEDVPEAVYDGGTPVYLGNRPGEDRKLGMTGTVGRCLLFHEALDDTAIRSISDLLGYGDKPEGTPPGMTVTTGPEFHWFGYYDKLEIDPSGRYLLGMEVGFEHLDPHPTDAIRVGMVDLEDGNRWIDLGESRAWNWQQGCMLQWRPGSPSEILWNDRVGDGVDAHYVTRILDVFTGELRTLPRPIYTVSPLGDIAVGIDFARLNSMRAGYGYKGVPDRTAEEPAPPESTIYRIDLNTGESEDLVSVADVAAIPARGNTTASALHYFNHLQFNWSGTRLLFFHRWRVARTGFETRIFTMRSDGTDLLLLTDEPGLSHYSWIDDRRIVLYSASRGGYALYDYDLGYERMLYNYPNGHESVLPGGSWMLSDTYPDRDRFMHPYLYNISTDEIVPIGRFYSPEEYKHNTRVDLHPRHSADCTMVVVDTPHMCGRQLHVIYIGDITGGCRRP
jgi:hypothetical protein